MAQAAQLAMGGRLLQLQGKALGVWSVAQAAQLAMGGRLPQLQGQVCSLSVIQILALSLMAYVIPLLTALRYLGYLGLSALVCHLRFRDLHSSQFCMRHHAHLILAI